MHLTRRKEYDIPNTLLRVHTDHLATPRAVTQGDGTTRKVLWRWEGDAFGDVAPTKPTTSTFTLPVRMAGQYFDSEVGISYNYFRDYDPSAGRYVQSDPIGLQGGVNTYGYVGGSPLKAVDPFGQIADTASFPTEWPRWVPPPIPIPSVNTCLAVGSRLLGMAAGLAIPGSLSCDPVIECPNDKCDPPAGVPFNKVTHYARHGRSTDPNDGSHGCMAKTGSPVHWHYDVNDLGPDGKCHRRKHVFGGCGVAPP